MAAKQKGMVDVSSKKDTKRKAIATSRIVLSKKAFKALIEEKSPKGDVLEVARLAAIMAVKNTPQLIPMCHPLEINQVKVDFSKDEKASAVTTKAEVTYIGKTGVEMEALMAVSIASLTIYDMMKWCDKGMVIEETQLLHKSGGKSGDYNR